MADWPLTSDLGPLGALPTAPRLARGFIGVVLTAWGLTALADVTELLVSELTANVVRASTGPDGNPRYDNEGKLPLLWVRLLSDHFRIMVEVWDNLPPALGTPVVRHPGPDEESGRGLEMIDALSEDWGWESVPGWKGKRVWAVLLAPLAAADLVAAGLVESRADRGVRQQGLAGDSDQGTAAGHEIDGHCGDPAENAQFAGYRVNAVLAGHPGNGVRRGGQLLMPFRARDGYVLRTGRGGRSRRRPRGSCPARRSRLRRWPGRRSG